MLYRKEGKLRIVLNVNSVIKSYVALLTAQTGKKREEKNH